MPTQVPYSKGCLSQNSTSVVVGFRTVLGDKIGYGDDRLSSYHTVRASCAGGGLNRLAVNR